MEKERINKMKLLCKDKYEKIICNKVFWLTALLMTVCTAIATSYGRAKTLSNKTKKKEIDELLSKKIAESEYTLAKERLETMSAVNNISTALADEVLLKLGIDVKNKETEL